MSSYLVNSYEVCLYYTYECITQYSLANELLSASTCTTSSRSTRTLRLCRGERSVHSVLFVVSDMKSKK